ncbi:RagB/SusD family nutrient uptake outer membrane protein [Pedobacter sp. BS3]|uniref:RagB/SusD family nutrient uptake outer membrane protein n=1 Tax=Pedobacter sp. BS3 TaxID=2567937 RepID=UPI0011EDC510|nr:RagB/SusD family nutrient uptake outer membrane protein [Pedobacter sp. BS3]TZF83642.1 RagB/SusD family nutrient uptake outer membrane protein [Pedobacter sp. BS3]
MKTTRYYLVLMVAALITLSSACKKYLDLEPPSAFDEKYVFSSVSSATSAVLGVYDRLAGDQAYGSRLSMMYPYDTDEMIGVTNAASPDNSSRDLSRYNLQPSNAQLSAPFNQLYAGVERANICIKNIPAMDLYTNGSADDKKQLQRLYGEALTLRAQFYLELIRNWGDIPAQFEPSIDQPDLFLPKTDRDEIYDRLIADLKTAEDLVPWRTEVASDERITKGAVKALRARMALYRGGYSLRRESGVMERRPDYLTYYQIARDECYDIMQHRDQHTLNPSFQAVFKDGIDSYKIEPHGEVMFEVAMAREVDSKLGYYDGPRFYIPGNTALLGNGSVRVVPVYFYAFNSLDTRRDVTTTPYYNNADKTKAVQTLVNMTSGKFRSDWINPALTSAIQATGINWPIIRFSDVLLMFAEAENELNNGPTADAKNAYEEVRKRAFKGHETEIGVTPSTKEDFFNAIVNERYFEFGGEGIRKYDLIRWNLLGQKIQEARDNYTKMLNQEAPYDKLPKYMYYKPGSTEVIWGNSLYEPSPATAPTGYTRVNWVASITTTWITNLAQLFRPNHSELLPIPQSARDANPLITQDYGY